jgi:hypothetical protein
MHRDNTLSAGTKFYNSILGHRNFVYPGLVWDTLIEDTGVTHLPFVGGGNKTAVRVPEHTVKHGGDPGKKVIIWIEKNEIL